MLHRLARAGIAVALARIGSHLRIESAPRLGWSALALGLAFVCQCAAASSDPLIGILSGKGDAGLGVAWRFERSPYRGGGIRYDLVPLYLFEGNFVYLHAYRFGLKIDRRPDRRLDLFLSHRFEGFPYDRIPASLAGMAERGPGGRGRELPAKRRVGKSLR